MTPNDLIEELQAQGIKSKKVLSAIAQVDRADFVPESSKHLAYENRPLAIGDEQTISQPYVVALMLELLDLKDTDKVLEIGTGSGYQTALLAHLAKHVYSAEIIKTLSEKSEEQLKALGFTNISLKTGDGIYLWKDFAPFDKIVVSAAAPHFPSALVEQLKEGGLIVTPVGHRTQHLVKGIKVNSKIHLSKNIMVKFVPMTGQVQHSSPPSL